MQFLAGRLQLQCLVSFGRRRLERGELQPNHLAQKFVRSERFSLRRVPDSPGPSRLVMHGRLFLARVKPQPTPLVENPMTALASELRQNCSPSLPSLSAYFSVSHLFWDEVKSRQFGLWFEQVEPSSLGRSLDSWSHIILVVVQIVRLQEHCSCILHGDLHGDLTRKHSFDQRYSLAQASLR